MTVQELIDNLKATNDFDKEVCIDVGGVRYILQNRLLGYENHVDIIADEKYKGNDFYNFDNQFNELCGKEISKVNEVKGDLISRSALINNIKAFAENIRDFRTDNKCFFTEENIIKAINEQPTAYDVEKVIEQIHEGLYVFDIPSDIVDDIVRKGGVE